MLTKEKFAEAYATRSGTTAEALKAMGMEPRPCKCGEESCEGWQMANVANEDWPDGSEFPKSDPRFVSVE